MGRSLASLGLFALLAGTLLAGCAASDAGEAAEGDGTAPPPGTGAIAGVVVDQAIRPVADANVSLSGAGVAQSTTSAEDGTFRFDALAPGNYLVSVRTLLHAPAQASVEVLEGEVAVPKVLVQRLFTQDAFHETQKFDGFIQCGYDATVISSLCANDYTRFVTDPQCPQCEHLLGDNRGTDFAVGTGWQTMVYEMTWEPPLQATSERMRLIVSHTPRVASHWYCSTSGPDPVYLRMDVNVTCEDQQDEPEQVPPEGLPNMHLFAAVDAPPGQFAAVTFSQRFTVFMNFFYYGTAPDGWSFIRGDEYPF